MAQESTPDVGDWPSMATAPAFIEHMTETDALNVLWAMRVKFGWYTEVFDRADIESIWDSEQFGKLNEDLVVRILGKANDHCEREAFSFFAAVVTSLGSASARTRGQL